MMLPPTIQQYLNEVRQCKISNDYDGDTIYYCNNYDLSGKV